MEMPVEALVESASAKRGSDDVADNEERARLRLRAEGQRSQKHDMQDVLETQAKTRARLEPRRGQKRESTQPLPDLEEEVMSSVPVESGSAPIQGGLSSSADVPVNSSVATSLSVEDTVQSSDPISASVGIHLASPGTVGSLRFGGSKAKEFEKMANLVLTSNAFPGTPSSESVQGLSNPALFVHVERDERLLVHGDDFMLEMPIKKSGSKVNCSLNTMEKCTRKFHSDGSTLTETSFLSRVIGIPHLVQPKRRLMRGTSQWCFGIWDWRRRLLL